MQGMCKCLLENGADPNKGNSEGQTALMRAAMNGCLNCVDILVDAGAYVNGRDDSGRTALLCCLIEGKKCVKPAHRKVATFPNVSLH